MFSSGDDKEGKWAHCYNGQYGRIERS